METEKSEPEAGKTDGRAEDGIEVPGEGESPSPEPEFAPVSPPQVYAYRDLDAVAEAGAKRFVDSARRAVEARDRFLVVLAGGSTPRPMYERLTREPYRSAVAWHRVFFLFGDERCVPPDHEDSNYRMAREALFEPLGIEDVRILRMKGEQPPADAARRYEVRLGDLFLGQTHRRFDLTLLGIGRDGHTASLFPGGAALGETERWVVADHVPSLDAWRLTLTLKALNASRRVIFLAAGDDKAQVVAEAFGGVAHEGTYPCERVRPFHARREVLLDAAAASKIPTETKD